MNLMFLAQSGMNSAQAGLGIIGNNIANGLNDGYSRRIIMLGEAGGKTTGYGFFGYGVQIDGVQRAYDGFINDQLRGAYSEFSSIKSHYEGVSKIDNMLGDTTNNISIGFGSIFECMQKMSSDPVSLAARQETYAQFKSLSYKFQSDSKTLNGLEKSTNTGIDQSVESINNCLQQIATLNEQIEKIHNQTGNLPADLLDSRDSQLKKLSAEVDIRVNENPTTGRVDVTLANGMPLVNGNQTYGLESRPSAANPNINEVFYIDASGNSLLLDESKFTGGKLGGLFTFRNEDLVTTRNELDQLALQMANEFNTVNAQGYDLNGEPGGEIYNIPNPVPLANRNNTSNTALDVTYTNISDVNAIDYTLVFKGPGESDWQVTTSNGRTITPEIGDNGELLFEGIAVKPNGVPEAGDSFLLNPVSGAAAGISMAISDGNQIAASSSPDMDDQSNNENLLALLAVKDKPMIGKSTFAEAYASMVSSIGNKTHELKSTGDTSAKTLEEFQFQQQSLTGVDMAEEYINLAMFSYYYQANSQVLQTAMTIFDTILSIR